MYNDSPNRTLDEHRQAFIQVWMKACLCSTKVHVHFFYNFNNNNNVSRLLILQTQTHQDNSSKLNIAQNKRSGSQFKP